MRKMLTVLFSIYLIFALLKQKLTIFNPSFAYATAIFEVYFGTVLNLIIPQVERPSWLPSSLSVSNNATAVIIVDDNTIHEVWKTRLESHCKTLHMKSPDEFLNASSSLPGNSFFLVDYELGNKTINGLDLIRLYLQGHDCYLVTSHYMSNDVIAAALKDGIPVIPKFLAPYIPVVGKS